MAAASSGCMDAVRPALCLSSVLRGGVSILRIAYQMLGELLNTRYLKTGVKSMDRGVSATLVKDR